MREYNAGFVRINGEDLPVEPGGNHPELRLDDANGTDVPERQAFVEQMIRNIPDKRQRTLVMLLTSMAEGVEGYFGALLGGDVANDGFYKGFTLAESAVQSNGQVMLLPTSHDKLHHISVSGDGTVRLRCEVGSSQAISMFDGKPVGIGLSTHPLTESSYFVEITIPKPQPGQTGIPDFTVDAIGNR